MPEAPGTGRPSRDDLAAARERYLTAILAGRKEAALEVAVGAAASGADVRDVYVDVLQESLYEVGRLWEHGRIPVATEQLATAITQLVVARLHEHLPRSLARRGRLVLTGVEGELHQVGGHLVADALESDGWDVLLLGTGVRPPDVLEAISAHQAGVLGISCTLPESLPRAAFLIGAVRATFQAAAPRVVVGGGAFREAPHRAARVGADAFAADARDAVGLLRAYGR